MSEWMNIGIKDVNIQTLINLWSNGQLLGDTQLNALLNVYGLELVNLPYQSVRFYKSGSNSAYITVDRSNTSLTIRDKYFISQTIKFKGTTDRQTKIFTKTSNNIYIIAEQTTWNSITLYLNEFGMEILGGGYTWNQENLLENAIINPNPLQPNDRTSYREISTRNGYLSFDGYQTLGKTVSGVGGNKPYPNTRHSFDVKDYNGVIQGYKYFDLININAPIKYIGCFGDNGKNISGGGYWSNLNSTIYIDDSGQEYNGPFLVYKFDNTYYSYNDKAIWTKDSKWYVSNLDLRRINSTASWYIYINKNISQPINSENYSFLNNKYINWDTKHWSIDCTLEDYNDYAMSFDLDVEMPFFTENVELFDANKAPTDIINISSDTSEVYTLIQTDNGSKPKYLRAAKQIGGLLQTYWKTGNYSDSQRIWQAYGSYWFDSEVPLCKERRNVALNRDIQITQLNWPIKINGSVPTDYPYYRDATQASKWDRTYHDSVSTYIYQFGSAHNADMWIMRDFADIKWMSGTETKLSTISLATDNWPQKTEANKTLTNSLSTWRSRDASGSKLEYGFFTLYADDASNYIYLIFAVKDLNGNDF